MPNTRLTAEKVKLHFQYSKMIYLIIIIVAGIVGSLVFTMTAYQAPNPRRVDIELIGVYSDTGTDSAQQVMDGLLAAGQAYEQARDEASGASSQEGYELPLQTVQLYSLQYDPESNAEDTYYASQKYMVTIAAQEGDIYVLSRVLMVELLESNILVPLDDYIDQGIIDPGDRDLSKVTFDAYDDDGNAIPGETHVYALQADALTGMADALAYDPAGKYLCVVQFSQNQDTAAAVLQGMIDMFTPEVTEAEAAEADS